MTLATLYAEQDKYEQAEPLMKRTLAIREEHLGTEHPSTASSLHNLALLYEAQGKYGEAEPLLKRALAIYEHVLGREHPQTQTAHDDYILLLQTIERNNKADAQPNEEQV